MRELGTLPKEFAIVVFLKVLLVILLILSLGFLLVGGVSAYLYLADYPTSTIVVYACMAWVVFILLLLCLYFRVQSKVNHKKEQLMQFVHMELLATVALRGLNVALRKWNKDQRKP